MSAATTWREVLADITSDPQEKQRLCHELNVAPTTLTAWVQGEMQPHRAQFQRLLEALPAQRRVLLPLVALELEQVESSHIGDDSMKGANLSDHITDDGGVSEVVDIPAAFYAQVLQRYACTPQATHGQHLVALILQQALLQLDPERKGLLLTLARCMPPSTDGKVRSLCEYCRIGTSPWEHNHELDMLMLGAESLAGYAINSNRTLIIDEPDEQWSRCVPPLALTVSAAALFIQRTRNIGGCLLISSTQRHYFTPARIMLMQHYSDLLALSLASDNFYASTYIELATMPTMKLQRK